MISYQSCHFGDGNWLQREKSFIGAYTKGDHSILEVLILKINKTLVHYEVTNISLSIQTTGCGIGGGEEGGMGGVREKRKAHALEISMFFEL